VPSTQRSPLPRSTVAAVESSAMIGLEADLVRRRDRLAHLARLSHSSLTHPQMREVVPRGPRRPRSGPPARGRCRSTPSLGMRTVSTCSGDVAVGVAHDAQHGHLAGVLGQGVAGSSSMWRAVRPNSSLDLLEGRVGRQPRTRRSGRRRRTRRCRGRQAAGGRGSPRGRRLQCRRLPATGARTRTASGSRSARKPGEVGEGRVGAEGVVAVVRCAPSGHLPG
jgi:hypothetical protein